MADEKKPEEPKEPKPKAAKAAKPPTGSASTTETSKARPCLPDDRAAQTGLKRFKLRLDSHPSGPRSQRYVLASDRDAAVACYCEGEEIDPKEIDGNDVKLIVTELAD